MSFYIGIIEETSYYWEALKVQPLSNIICLSFFPQFLTSVEPVNATLSMFIWLAIAAPAVGPNPGTIFTTPGGKPACMSWWKEWALFLLFTKHTSLTLCDTALYFLLKKQRIKWEMNRSKKLPTGTETARLLMYTKRRFSFQDCKPHWSHS